MGTEMGPMIIMLVEADAPVLKLEAGSTEEEHDK